MSTCPRFNFSLQYKCSLLTSAATAQVCTPEPLYGEIYSYEIHNQSALDTLARGCTSINGSVSITYNYTGPVYLPNIRSIDGDLIWYPESLDVSWGRLSKSAEDAISQKESISVPDLEHLGGDLQFRSLHIFRNISAPKLNAVEGFVSIDYAYDVDLRSLRNADQVHIYGNLSRYGYSCRLAPEN